MLAKAGIHDSYEVSPRQVEIRLSRRFRFRGQLLPADA